MLRARGLTGPKDSVCGNGYDRERWDKCAATAKIAATAEKTFGLHLLRDMVNRMPGKNVFISPMGVFLTLEMAENGSAGDTRTAMRKVLELPDLDAAALNASAAALQGIVARPRLNIANALWADRHYSLAPDFVKLCDAVFGARAASLDFADPRAAAVINDWVNTKTEGKIGSIAAPRVVAKAAVLLTNAVYFSGRWAEEFSVQRTRDEVFRKTDGGTKAVPMMHQSGLERAYRKGNNFEAAILEYRESGVFFHALLPEPGSTPKEVLASLDPEHLTDGPEYAELDLRLPRFSVDFTAGLNDHLEKMGMEIAFRYGRANFGPMGSREFFISDVIHKTHLEVDEKGTVAAAATLAGVMGGISVGGPPPKKTLVFDRPFVVLLGDYSTGTVLFAGVIEEP